MQGPELYLFTKLERHSASADLRQGSLLPPYGIVPFIIAELSWKFYQNPLIKYTLTGNCWKTVFPQQNFDYNSGSRVAWSRDPACTVPLTCQWTSRASVTLRRFGGRWLPPYGSHKCSILHFPACTASEGWYVSPPKFSQLFLLSLPSQTLLHDITFSFKSWLSWDV